MGDSHVSQSLVGTTPGETVHIVSVPDGTVRARLLRLGFLDGAVTCRRRVRKGPVVVGRNGTELAIGADLARQIDVEPASSAESPTAQ